MWAFLAAHPEYKYQRVTFPTKHLCDGGDYVTADKTDVRATLARFTPQRTT